ncbi:MAG: hypothetical protein PHP28_06860 [Actinomycetota bacterium]|nr:hypothetical protein [Actinomycetota bacterium]MDD5667302.1 hypothetical protein [Actinomycetota bacterium]
MDNQDDLTGTEGMPGVTEPVEGEGPPRRAGGVRVEKKRRKVSLIAAIVFNVVTLITLAIILLAVLLPGYRRSFTVARATRGSEEVLILVRTSESKMRENNTDFISAQDGLRNALQEEVGGGEVWAYVRDNYPDRAWIEDNLPEGMQEWLQELYPKPAADDKNSPGKLVPNGEVQPEDSQ